MARKRAQPRRVVSYRIAPARSESAPTSNSLLIVGGVVLGALAVLAIAIVTGVFRLPGSGTVGAPVGGSGATPSSLTALPAGTYQSRALQPALSFTVPDGWAVAADSADYLALQPVSSDQAGIFVFRDPSAASQAAACPIAPEPGVGGLSSDLATWIRGRPGLVASKPRLAEVGGLRGVEIDLSIAAGWTASCPFASGVPTVPLFVDAASGLRWVVAGSERLRLSLLDVPGGGTVVVDIDAFDGRLWDGLVSAATPIVRSFAFQGATDTPTPGASAGS